MILLAMDGSRRWQQIELTKLRRDCIMEPFADFNQSLRSWALVPAFAASRGIHGQGTTIMTSVRRPATSKVDDETKPQRPLIGPPAEERPTFLVNRVNAKLAQVANRLFRVHGIDVVSSRILIYLLEREEVRVGELVDLLALPQSTISHQLQRLEKAKLIRKRRTREDNRAVAVVLTAAGRFAAQECNAFSLDVHRQMASHLGEREMRQLHLLLLRMYEILHDIDTSP